ncbi:hypothetical protein, partial [Fodinicola feengrottensis]|uniref:hypothetical protein n=1 Tax=Fodinicola feengrottensis TaxID=435914 RepID=UPI0013D09D33
MFLVGSVGLGVVLFVGTRNSARRQVRENRERYLDYLENLRRLLRKVVEPRPAEAASVRHPTRHTLIGRVPAARQQSMEAPRASHPDALD